MVRPHVSVYMRWLLWYWDAGVQGRCPGGPAQITSDTVRSAEARPGLDHGQDGGRMPASWPSLHGSLSPPITPGYQHTWTCTCVRSTPDPRPSLSNDHPPPSQLPWGCSVTNRSDVYIWNNSVPASLYSHRCHYYPSLEDRMWPRGDLGQHWGPGLSSAASLVSPGGR